VTLDADDIGLSFYQDGTPMLAKCMMLSRSEVANAIALTTDLVTVDLLAPDLFITKPPNLFDLRFNDKRVGITDDQMGVFKNHLKQLLLRQLLLKQLSPLTEVIDRVPDDASLLIRDVAELVGRALARVLGYLRLGGTEAASLEGFESVVVGEDVSAPTIISPGAHGSGEPRPDDRPEFRKVDHPFHQGGSTRGMPSPPPSRASSRRASRTFTRAKPPARDEATYPSPRAQKKRVVSTGFAQQSSVSKPLGASLPLAFNEDYYFWLEVGPPVRGAIDVAPQALPEKYIPRDALLKVALFDFDEGLRITRGADVGEIQLQPDGTATVVRQPVEPQGVSTDSRLFKKRLFFPVRTGDRPNESRLRCNIYYEQVLVQSRLVRVRVMRRPKSIKRALSTIVDYTLSRTLNPAHVADMEPHRLSLMLNDNGNGTHGFRFFGGKGFKNDASFDGQELQDFINLARGVLRQAAWGDKDPWKEGKAYLYAGSHNPQQPRDLGRLKTDLVRFAIWGYRFYDTIISKLTDTVEQSDELAELMRTPGMIQIALKQSARYVFPAAMIYDYPLETNAAPGGHTLCPSFLQALNSSVLLGDSECFEGNCPSKDADTVVCPSGFWGYRHSLGMPLSLKNAPDAPSELTWEGKPQITIGVSTDQAFVWRPAHEKALQALQPQLGWNYANTRADVLKLLKASTSHLVYFYCHGGMSGTVPFIQVGPATERGITRDNLRREKIRWKSPRPLVFINGCHTAALEPDVAMEFISAFVEVAGACGVIGTEITIFELLARAFAEECLGRFLKGERIGDAIRGARLKLLKDGNPLGLVYIPYVIASLHMIQKPADN